MRRREHRPRARYWMYFARKRLWKSLRIVSLTKVLPFFSGAPRAWWRKTTSSFQRLFTAPDGACVRINSKSKGAVKSLAGRRLVEERVRRGGGLGLAQPALGLGAEPVLELAVAAERLRADRLLRCERAGERGEEGDAPHGTAVAKRQISHQIDAPGVGGIDLSARGKD